LKETVHHSDSFFNPLILLCISKSEPQGHSLLRPHLQALFDGCVDVPFRLCFRLSLADTTGDRGAFGDEHAVFILKYGDEKFHPLVLLIPFSGILKKILTPGSDLNIH